MALNLRAGAANEKPGPELLQGYIASETPASSERIHRSSQLASPHLARSQTLSQNVALPGVVRREGEEHARIVNCFYRDELPDLPEAEATSGLGLNSHARLVCFQLLP